MFGEKKKDKVKYNQSTDHSETPLMIVTTVPFFKLQIAKSTGVTLKKIEFFLVFDFIFNPFKVMTETADACFFWTLRRLLIKYGFGSFRSFHVFEAGCSFKFQLFFV